MTDATLHVFLATAIILNAIATICLGFTKEDKK